MAAAIPLIEGRGGSPLSLSLLQEAHKGWVSSSTTPLCRSSPRRGGSGGGDPPLYLPQRFVMGLSTNPPAAGVGRRRGDGSPSASPLLGWKTHPMPLGSPSPLLLRGWTAHPVPTQEARGWPSTPYLALGEEGV